MLASIHPSGARRADDEETEERAIDVVPGLSMQSVEKGGKGVRGCSSYSAFQQVRLFRLRILFLLLGLLHSPQQRDQPTSYAQEARGRVLTR